MLNGKERRSGRNERAHVDFSGTDLSGKRSDNPIESLRFLQLLEVGLRRSFGRFLFVAVLFRYDFFRGELAPAGGRGIGEIVGRFCLRYLLIDFGRLNLRQKVSFLDVVTNVHLPTPDITIRPWINDCFLKGRNVSRKNKLLRLGIALHGHDFDAHLRHCMRKFFLFPM